MIIHKSKFMAVTALALLGVATAACAADMPSVRFGMPSAVSADVAIACDSRGPTVTLESGGIVLSGLTADVTFRQNKVHQTTVPKVFSAVLLGLNKSITIPKQPPLDGVGGNPWIYLQLLDDNGFELGQEILVGRCKQSNGVTRRLEADYLVALLAQVSYDVDCSNNGPWITLFGNATVEDTVHVRVIFRNNAQGTHENGEFTGYLSVVLSGQTVKIPKQPPLGGSGGNPRVLVQLKGANGALVGDPIDLGRPCSGK